MRRSQALLSVFAVLQISGFLAACETSGAGVAEPAEDSAALLYLTPSPAEADVLTYIEQPPTLDRYDRVMLEPVRIFPNDVGGYGDVERGDVRALAGYFHDALRLALGRNYGIVGEPGSGVMRVRASITEVTAQLADPGIGAHSQATYIQAKLKRSARQDVSGVEVAVEVKILDSQSDERLAGMVDERLGKAPVGRNAAVWERVKPALDYWAERLRGTLARHREDPSVARQGLNHSSWLIDDAVDAEHFPFGEDWLRDGTIAPAVY